MLLGAVVSDHCLTGGLTVITVTPTLTLAPCPSWTPGTLSRTCHDSLTPDPGPLTPTPDP